MDSYTTHKIPRRTFNNSICKQIFTKFQKFAKFTGKHLYLATLVKEPNTGVFLWNSTFTLNLIFIQMHNLSISCTDNWSYKFTFLRRHLHMFFDVLLHYCTYCIYYLYEFTWSEASIIMKDRGIMLPLKNNFKIVLR